MCDELLRREHDKAAAGTEFQAWHLQDRGRAGSVLLADALQELLERGDGFRVAVVLEAALTLGAGKQNGRLEREFATTEAGVIGSRRGHLSGMRGERDRA